MAWFEIHIHQTVDTNEVVKKLNRLIKQNTEIMGELEDINAQLDRIDTAHTAIKKDLDFIKKKLENAGTGSLPAADVQAIKNRVTGIADKFAALDEETDSTEPEPEPTPDPNLPTG